jgi:hypothetical protein
MGLSAKIGVRLEAYYVGSLWAAVALHDFKAYFVALVKGFEACALDSREVYEYIFTAVALDKTETFFCVKPFNSTSHSMAS